MNTSRTSETKYIFIYEERKLTNVIVGKSRISLFSDTAVASKSLSSLCFLIP